MRLESLKNWRQQHDYDCLVACCKQILDHLGIEKSEEWLWDQLSATSGDRGVTPFPNVKNLGDALGVVVEYHENGTVAHFAPYIESRLPILVAVTADEPQSWPYVGEHAVVVIGFDESNIYVNDPAHPETGLAVDINTFLLAWSERDYEFAVIRLA